MLEAGISQSSTLDFTILLFFFSLGYLLVYTTASTLLTHTPTFSLINLFVHKHKQLNDNNYLVNYKYLLGIGNSKNLSKTVM